MNDDQGRLQAAGGVAGAVRAVLGALLDLGLPGECAGCRRPAPSLCRACLRRLDGLAYREPSAWPQAATVRSRADLPVLAWGRYEPPARGIITRWKDHGRHDLDAVLAPCLAGVIAHSVALLPQSTPVLVVPAPSSARSTAERGDVPVARLATRAVTLLPGRIRARVRVAPALAHRRAVADQLGLSRAQRERNVQSSMWVPPGWQPVLRHRHLVLVDDILTTGATLRECARSVREVTGLPVVAAVAFAASSP